MEELEKKAIQTIIKEEEEYANYDGEDRMVSSVDLETELTKDPKNEFKLFTQFSALNSAFDGFKLGNVILIAGHTNHGKTELGIDFAQYFVSQENNISWFAFETMENEVIKRFKRKCGELPVFYIPRKRKDTFKWFEHKVKEAIIKFDSKIIFIDSLRELTYMPDASNDRNLSSNYSVYVGQIMQRIQNIARDNGIIIFLLVDPKAADETQSLSRRDVGRDSSLITSIPDAVLTIWQECKQHREGVDYSGNVWLNILKNREYGQKGKIKLKFENWRFYEVM